MGVTAQLLPVCVCVWVGERERGYECAQGGKVSDEIPLDFFGNVVPDSGEVLRRHKNDRKSVNC